MANTGNKKSGKKQKRTAQKRAKWSAEDLQRFKDRDQLRSSSFNSSQKRPDRSNSFLSRSVVVWEEC